MIRKREEENKNDDKMAVVFCSSRIIEQFTEKTLI